jgi:hypothetical protein
VWYPGRYWWQYRERDLLANVSMLGVRGVRQNRQIRVGHLLRRGRDRRSATRATHTRNGTRIRRFRRLRFREHSLPPHWLLKRRMTYVPNPLRCDCGVWEPTSTKIRPSRDGVLGKRLWTGHQPLDAIRSHREVAALGKTRTRVCRRQAKGISRRQLPPHSLVDGPVSGAGARPLA